MKYIIRPGDTLEHVADHFHMSIQDLMKANPSIKNPNLIQAGKTLQVPQHSTAPPLPLVSATSPDAAVAVDTFKTIAWGKKVPPAFKSKVIQICTHLAMNPDFLMSAIAFESAETFSPSVKNKDSGATGLIQFMPSTATALGTSITKLEKMNAEDQLDYVEKYFFPYKGRLTSIEDTYMAILWPAAIGKKDDFVLFEKPSIAYQQNRGLDRNRDGKVTKIEAAEPVKEKLRKGRGGNFQG